MKPRSPFLFAAVAVLGMATIWASSAVTPVRASTEPQPLFDLDAIRDPATLEIKVLHDWKPAARNSSIRQKLIEITVCEWWPGQKVRLPVTLSAPYTGRQCRNVLVANQGLAPATAGLSAAEVELIELHGVGLVMIGMGTIDAMEPKGQLHLGMREQLLKTKDVRYTPAWIWGMSQMRALTAAMTEPKVFQPEKVLVTGGSKRGVASAIAGIHDDRFTAIMPVVAPPLGNPGGTMIQGTEPEELLAADERFFADLAGGKLELGEPAAVKKAVDERTQRRAEQRITLEQAKAAGWSDEEIENFTDRAWDASRVVAFLPELKKRKLQIFYNLGTNDNVSPALVELGERHPDFPVCIIPGGQHGGPPEMGFTRQVPKLKEVQDNLRSFALHHFFQTRRFPRTPKIEGQWDAEKRTLEVKVAFPGGINPQKNEIWWSLDRSLPQTLYYEFDKWESMPMEKTGSGQYRAVVTLTEAPERIDFLSLHTHTDMGLPLTLSSAYQRVVTAAETKSQ